MPAPAPTPSPGVSRRFLVAGLCAAGALLGPCACAAEAFAASPVALSVVDRDTGETLAVHRHRTRAYMAGTPGRRYALRLSNRSPERLLVVLSVDGINVVSGETAAWHQTGYVLDPWRSHDIAGWRKSDSEVAAFEFAALSESYAARTGRPAHAGVIGMAVFFERPAPPPAPAITPSSRPAPPFAAADAARREDAAPQAPAPGERAAGPSSAGAAGGAADAREPSAALAPRSMEEARREAPAERLGTAHGRREASHARRVPFERASERPYAVVEIRYDSRENLVAAGVLRRPAPAAADPQPFPHSEARAGFVPDPPGR